MKKLSHFFQLMSDDCLYKISKFLPMSLSDSIYFTSMYNQHFQNSMAFLLLFPFLSLHCLVVIASSSSSSSSSNQIPKVLIILFFFPLIGFVFQDQKNKTINYIHYSFNVICFSWLGSLMLFIWEVHLMVELQNWLIYNFYLPLFQGY